MRSDNHIPGYQTYNNLWVMLPVSLVAAQIIVVHGDKRSFLELFLVLAYYKALAGSFIIALLIFGFIYFATRCLDNKLPWQNSPFIRTGLQILWGGLGALLFAILLAAGYYALQHVNILNTGYFQYLVDLVARYIILINVFYSWDYITSRFKKEENERQEVLEAEENNIDVEEIDTEEADIKETEEIAVVPVVALIYIKERNTLARSLSDEDMAWPYRTIVASFASLPADLYFIANRSCIVYAGVITNVKQSKNNLILTLKKPFQNEVIVAKNRVPEFRAFSDAHNMHWWDKENKRFV